MKQGIVMVAIFGFCASLLAGCASIDRSSALDPAVRQLVEPLQLVPGADPWLLRLDVFRDTHPNLNYATTGLSVDQALSDYSPLVTDLGNGVVYDSNGNLAVDLIRYFQLSRLAQFRLVEVPHSLLAASTVYSRDGATSRVAVQAPLGNELLAVQDQGLYRFSLPPLATKAELSLNATQARLSRPGKAGAQEFNQISPQLVQSRGIAGQPELALNGPEFLTIGTVYELQTTDDRLLLRYKAPFAGRQEWTLIRTATGLLLSRQGGPLVEVSRSAEGIQITRDGRLERELRFEAEPPRGN